METIQAEKTLRVAIQSIGGDLLNLTDEEFQRWAEKLDPDAQKLLLEQYRGSRNFYKTILQEERAKVVPHAYRYEDAAKKLKIYNAQGKILSELVK